MLKHIGPLAIFCILSFTATVQAQDSLSDSDHIQIEKLMAAAENIPNVKTRVEYADTEKWDFNRELEQYSTQGLHVFPGPMRAEFYIITRTQSLPLKHALLDLFKDDSEFQMAMIMQGDECSQLGQQSCNSAVILISFANGEIFHLNYDPEGNDSFPSGALKL